MPKPLVVFITRLGILLNVGVYTSPMYSMTFCVLSLWRLRRCLNVIIDVTAVGDSQGSLRSLRSLRISREAVSASSEYASPREGV